uniref:Uncharacterized protein n=1 Tax=Xenopus tropicalis TaxID=8364 RepID=A0A803J924_XENTR
PKCSFVNSHVIVYVGSLACSETAAPRLYSLSLYCHLMGTVKLCFPSPIESVSLLPSNGHSETLLPLAYRVCLSTAI